MKTCPYCAEEIKDAAIRCRWCQMWLVESIPAGAEGPPPKVEERKSASKEAPKPMPQATVLQPVPPSEPKPAQPAAEAKPAQPAPVPQPAAVTPAPAPVAQTPPVAQPTPAPQAAPAQAAPAAAAQAAPAPATDAKVEFTHTGSRYLLGYGADFFGIWDRNAPQQPIERFPRNDQGWATAWQRYSSIETNWMDLRSGQKSG